MNRHELEEMQRTEQALMQEEVKSKLITLRDKQVILDSDLAALYGVETRVLNQAVKRNMERFPEGYMFQLSQEELKNLISQNVTSSWGGVRKAPYAFTEQGLYMMATILKSKNAVAATIAIIETFAQVRELKRELLNLHNESNPEIQQSKIKRFGDILSGLVMPDLDTSETESSLEINFIIGKLKYTVKRKKVKAQDDEE